MSRTITDLGWTREDAIRIRGQFAAFLEDWDDPDMDVYDDLSLEPQEEKSVTDTIVSTLIPS